MVTDLVIAIIADITVNKILPFIYPHLIQTYLSGYIGYVNLMCDIAIDELERTVNRYE
jgi:hypothetical protein